ncbi:hypothetical protein HMPREF0673_01265 [Leyella stercorea DSM 18206]|uniref:Uncharacterized protein n=1 Tax=Leyella stercorea DSM 18206 TaxID=1002367 RepID=G6AXB1_9BACT|nr:hypothetical protein HMPREF0673_01265 [Leyella stercorea DSM 18206]
MKILTLILSLFIATASTAATKTSHKEYAAKGSTTIKVFDKVNVHYAPTLSAVSTKRMPTASSVL